MNNDASHIFELNVVITLMLKRDFVLLSFPYTNFPTSTRSRGWFGVRDPFALRVQIEKLQSPRNPLPCFLSYDRGGRGTTTMKFDQTTSMMPTNDTNSNDGKSSCDRAGRVG